MTGAGRKEWQIVRFHGIGFEGEAGEAEETEAIAAAEAAIAVVATGAEALALAPVVVFVVLFVLLFVLVLTLVLAFATTGVDTAVVVAVVVAVALSAFKPFTTTGMALAGSVLADFGGQGIALTSRGLPIGAVAMPLLTAAMSSSLGYLWVST